MKIKTSITLSEELVQSIDEFSGQYKNRSVFLETAAWAFIAQLQRAARDARDIEIINRRAEYLNEEVRDALTYQVSL
jgi:metal-responsive CopG/Arc/MetJ family transcriptional regulator